MGFLGAKHESIPCQDGAPRPKAAVREVSVDAEFPGEYISGKSSGSCLVEPHFITEYFLSIEKMATSKYFNENKNVGHGKLVRRWPLLEELLVDKKPFKTADNIHFSCKVAGTSIPLGWYGWIF